MKLILLFISCTQNLLLTADTACVTYSANIYSGQKNPSNKGQQVAQTLSHLDEKGQAKMVDVTVKEQSLREAIATGRVLMSPRTLSLIQEGGMPKGDVFGVARVAGIMAAKKTGELIPMCHPLELTHVEIRFDIRPESGEVLIEGQAKLVGRTGVEMEALTAVSVAALTIYDMCKAVDKEMVLTDIMLVRKSGGKSGLFERKI